MTFYHKLVTALGECCLFIILLGTLHLGGIGIGHLITISPPIGVVIGFVSGVALTYIYYRLTGDDT